MVEPNRYHIRKLELNFDRSTDRGTFKQIIWVENLLLVRYEDAHKPLNDEDHFDSVSDRAFV